MLSTFSILKARWQEVVLIAGLQAAGQFAFMQAAQNGGEDSAASQTVLPLAAFLLVLFWLGAKMLSFGFIRTGFLSGPLRCEPSMLLKIGHHFFWRIVGYEIIIGLLVAIVAMALFVGAQTAGFTNTKEQTAVALWGSMIGSALILAKPLLVGPASIIVMDCRMFQAFGYLKLFGISHAKKTIGLYVLWLVSLVLPAVISTLGLKAMGDSYAAMAGFAALSGFLLLAANLSAVKAVADKYLADDNVLEDAVGLEQKNEISNQDYTH